MFSLALLLPLRIGAEIVLSGNEWDKYAKLGAEAGVSPPGIVTTTDGQKSFHMSRPGGEKFGIYLIKVTQLPSGEKRFPVRLVSREVLDASNGLGIRNLTIDPDDPDSDATQQVQTSFVAILLSDSEGTGPRARDDRNLTADADPPNSLGGLSGAKVNDPTLSTITNPVGQLTTVNATLELRLGLNVLRLDATDPRDLPLYDQDPGYQLFSITIGPGDGGLQGTILGGISIRGDDWEKVAALGAPAGVSLPEIVTTVDGHRSFHMTRPSNDKFGIYAIKVSQLPLGKTRFPVKLLSRQVRAATGGLGIRNLTIDPDDPNSDRTTQVQNSFLSILVTDGGEGHCPRAKDDLLVDDHASVDPQCVGGIGLSGRLVQDETVSLSTSAPGEISTVNATLELRQGINLLRLDPTDPRNLPAYNPNAGYQVFLMTLGPDEPGLKGEAVQPCSVARELAPNPYFPGDVVTVTLSASNILGPTKIVDAFPFGWTVVDAGGGSLSGNKVTFNILGDGNSSYQLRAPATCSSVNFSGMTTGPYCSGEVIGDSRRLRCGIQTSGGVTGMLFLGPIDLGSAGPQCDDSGKLASTDYLSDGAVNEANLLFDLGDEVKPAFGATAGGLGIKAAPNAAINPRRAEGILTVWRADADSSGRINLVDSDNLGAVDNSVLYGLVYLENTTGTCLDAVLEVSSDDSIKVRLNGNLLHARSACRALAASGGGDMVPVLLSAGRNVLLIGLAQGTGGKSVRLMIRNPDGTPMADGKIAIAFSPPQAYPSVPLVTRAIQPAVARPEATVTVKLTAANVAGQVTRIADTFPLGWAVVDKGGGTLAGNTMAFDRSSDGSSVYTLSVPPSFSGFGSFRGIVTISGATRCGTVAGDPGISVVVRDFACTPDPGAPEPVLIEALAFGSRLLDCPTFNRPDVSYTMVHHSANDAPAASALAYDAARGWGYEVLYPDPANMPFGARSGFGAFGPFDDTKNERNEFPDRFPEELYDSNIGMKAFPQPCNQAAAGNTLDPCTRDTLLPGGEPYVPVGGIFRVDVPNGTYRFVAAAGDADNPHAHRILAEDGGSGPPSNLGPNYVTLVKSFDQSQYSSGETDPVEPGKGVFARVGFDCKIPPPGDGVTPSPKFVNMDRSGQATSGPPQSPELIVREGYIRIHQLQANSNPGPGSSDPDPNGSDLVVLELWRTKALTCPPNGDTHSTGLTTTGPEGNFPGRYTAAATAVDDTMDNGAELIRYTFTAQIGADPPLVKGPQAESTAAFDLTAGQWTITVEVDDDPACNDRAEDASRSIQLAVNAPAGGGQIPSDCNRDGQLDISDGICLLRFLFLGSPAFLPCGDGTASDPGNKKFLDSNGDGRIDLSDAVSLFRYLFSGGSEPVLGRRCVRIDGCPERCVP